MERFNIYQIYYNESQINRLDSGFKALYNPNANEYLENQVIIDNINNSNGEYTGFVSHKFKEKTGFTSQMIDKMEEGYDVYTFFGSLKNKEYFLFNMNRWHDGALEAIQEIFRLAGIDKDYCTVNYNNKQKKPTREIIYQNHFIARTEIYKRYVTEMLMPCVNVMKNADEYLYKLLWKDSKYSYAKKVPVETRIKVFGVPYYPLHPFLCERLFSIWLTINKEITVKQYFKSL